MAELKTNMKVHFWSAEYSIMEDRFTRLLPPPYFKPYRPKLLLIPIETAGEGEVQSQLARPVITRTFSPSRSPIALG